jgi:hypothetical protein
VFGRKKQQQDEAAREAERHALFEQLAKRPDTICPFLGLESARTEYRDRVSDGHRCYAFGEPAELSAEQQQKVCLQRGYGNCPRYLRGVLVIPTEELEALRHPKPAPPPPAPPPVPAAASGGGGRRGLVVALLLLVVAGGGGAAFLALNGSGGGVAQETPTPVSSPSVAPSGSLPAESATAGPTSTAQATATPQPTPVVLPSIDPSTSAYPTPGPNDTPTGFIVVVEEGQYPVVRMEPDGTITGEATATFADISGAPVGRIDVGGVLYWRTLAGEYLGLAYSRALSSAFVIYETYQTADGEARFRKLDAAEY